MDIGIGVAIAGVAFSGAAVGITVIKTKARGSNGNGHWTMLHQCAEHSGIKEALKGLSEGQDRIEKSIERIFHLHDEGKL